MIFACIICAVTLSASWHTLCLYTHNLFSISSIFFVAMHAACCILSHMQTSLNLSNTGGAGVCVNQTKKPNTMKSIEPENLVQIADEIDRHSNFDHEQLEVLIGLLLKLEDYQVTDCDFQFLADSFQTMADEVEGEVDYMPNLRAALGIKYMKAVGRL